MSVTDLSGHPPTPVGFREGVLESLPVMTAVLPFALLFGAAAAAHGYSLAEAVLASATIFAGASQFVIIEVSALAVPAWSVVLAVFAVNFRHLLYSASLGRHMRDVPTGSRLAAFSLLTDLQWAAGERRAAKGELTIGWYWGYALPLYVLWVLATGVGASFGALIDDPRRYGLDFLLPIYFLLILVGFRQRHNFWPVLAVSAGVAGLVHAVAGAPWHIAAGAVAGIGIAAVLGPARRD